MMTIINIENLDIVFGKNQHQALTLMDQGKERSFIKEKTGCMVGISDINISVNRGEIFVLMGLSGSGKSTLLRAINGLSRVTRGQIYLNLKKDNIITSHTIHDACEHSLRLIRAEHVAMVFQKFALFPWKSILDNVAFGLEIANMPRSIREARAMECLEMVQLSAWAKQVPAELSGGMLQRVGLARALATDASILLMDEPFSALDPLIKTNLQQELLRIQKTLNKTILFVTHDLDEAFKLGTRIAIMQNGKIVQTGSAEEIVSNPKTKYVKDFVANIDQTKLLRAKTIMTSLNQLKKDASLNSIELDEAGIFRCLLDESGRPRRSLFKDVEGRIIPWALFQSGTFGENDIVLGTEYLLIKDVIGAVSRTGRPMIIQDKSGKMIGAISTKCILSALALK